MPEFTHHIFVCGNQRKPGHTRGCCDPDGDDVLRDALKSAVRAKKLGSLVRVNKAGCLDQCELGPVLVIYPQAIWYGNVQLKDVERIVERTICRNEILEDLLIPAEKLNMKGCG